MTFDTLGLGAEVLRAVSEAGYTEPTPIQAQAIPAVLAGRDVLGIAQTGTGKTASFTLPLITLLAAGRPRARMPRSLILEPTRELAAQVAESFEKYGKYHRLSMALLIGGVSFGDQDRKLDRGVDVLIATPGRMLDQFERGKLMLTGVQVLVVDEADRMLDMGFIPDLERICKLLPPRRQTLFFSATMQPDIKRLADTFLTDPVEIAVARQATAAVTVTQNLVIVETRAKREALRSLIRSEALKNAIIFCNRKTEVDLLGRSLVRHGFNAAMLHGDMEQSDRIATLERFKSGEVQLLVASDVAARGLDIPDVSHVFNFDVPIHAEDYIHRIGRTGRAGREGRAFTLATPADGRFVRAIEDMLKHEIPRASAEGLDGQDLLSDSESKGERRGRSGKPVRRRGGEDEAPAKAPSRARRKPAAAKAPAAVAVPVEETVAEAVDEAPPSRRDEPERRAPPRAAPERIEAARPPRRDGRNQTTGRDEPPRRGRRDDDNGPVVIGFGDHMPAFMTRAVPPLRAARPAAAAEAESGDDDIPADEGGAPEHAASGIAAAR